ncbi:MAG: sigma factor-like helix-turn-helix DNA-binding protein, partial [Bacteroidales bacterium]
GLSEAGEDLHEELFAKELGLRLDAAVAAMPTQRRKVFEMTKIDGMSMGEVAEQLSLSKRTVERHLYLAMTDLKKIIEIFLLFHCVDCLCYVSY